MERLTMRNDKGMAFWRDPQSSGGGYRMVEDQKDQAHLDRLAAYEDAMPFQATVEQSGNVKVARIETSSWKKIPSACP